MQELRSRYVAGDLLAVVPGMTHVMVDYYWRDQGIEHQLLSESPEVNTLLRKWDRVWVIFKLTKAQSPLYSLGQKVGVHEVSSIIKGHSVEVYLLSVGQNTVQAEPDLD